MSLSRPLDSNEQLLFLCDSVSVFNFVFALNIDGGFSIADCRYAIERLQIRHPLLKVKIRRSTRGKLEFVSDESLQIPIIDFFDTPSNVAIWIEKELNNRFDALAGPLVRAALIRHTETNSTMLFTIHHSIGDGLSGCIFARDFLQLLSGNTLPPADKSLPDSIGMRLPPHLRKASGIFLHAKELLRTVMSSLTHGAPASHTVIDSDLSRRIVMVAPRKADPVQLKKMLVSCKANRCSMQGALGAAVLLALKKHIETFCATPVPSKKNKSSTTLQLLSPVNIRKKLVPPIGDEFGLYVATQATNHRLTDDTNFWKLASEITTELRSNIDTDSPLKFMPIASRYLVKLLKIGDSVFGGTRFSQWFCSTFPPCIALSNLGAVDVPSAYGEIRLNDLGVFASLSALGSVSSFTLTFNETLSWNFVAMSPSFTREQLETLANDAMQCLLAQTQNP